MIHSEATQSLKLPTEEIESKGDEDLFEDLDADLGKNINTSYIYCVQNYTSTVKHIFLHIIIMLQFRRFVKPRHACAARVTVVVLCVCVCVCPSVHGYSDTTGYRVAYERYKQL